MKKIFVLILASLAIGCGSSDSNNSTDTNISTSTGTSSVTTTVTVTKTETNTNTDTVTNTATNTGTTTAVSTFVYSNACNYLAETTVTGGASSRQSGFWTVTTAGQPDWNLCITKSKSLGSGGTDPRVAGYAYLASEQGQANPASLVRYEGVMAEKCIMVTPVSATSTGPDVLGNSMKNDGLGTITVTDGVTTATWTQAANQPGSVNPCPYETPANPSW